MHIIDYIHNIIAFQLKKRKNHYLNTVIIIIIYLNLNNIIIP